MPKFDALLGKIDSLVGPPGLRTSLRSKLNTGERLAERGNPCASANVVQAFINQVNAETPRMIPEGTSALLISQAQVLVDQLLDSVVCSSDPDSDGDLVADSAEVTLGTNPASTDSDGDNVPDGLELLHTGTDPLDTDTDGNGTSDGDEDPDKDGCTTGTEAGSTQGSGGRRDPLSFWDFIDQYTGIPLARDGGVVTNDISAIVARFGTVPASPLTKTKALAQALTVPSDASSYHASADRGGADPLGNPWDLFPPDGGIVTNDISALVAQFGHTCAPPAA